MRPDLRTSISAFVFVVVLGLALAWLAFPQLRGDNDPSDPERALKVMEDHDDGLAPALAAADAGDPVKLAQWLNNSEAETRHDLARIIHAELCSGLPGHRSVDPRLCWQYRTRLRAFANVSTGEDDLDVEFDNLLAYAIATGPNPTPDELAAAKQIAVPRLKDTVRLKLERGYAGEAGSLEDTIGCVYFATGDYNGARDAFTNALTHESPELIPLGKARLAAAAANATATITIPPGNLRPLPQESEFFNPDGTPISATAAAMSSRTATGAIQAPAAASTATEPVPTTPSATTTAAVESADASAASLR
jgi:hypothetical protein